MLAGVSMSLTLLGGLALLASDVLIEDAAIRDLLERELSFLIGPHAQDDDLGGHDTLRYYTDRDVPAALRDFAPGYHDDVRFHDRPFALLVRELDHGERAYLSYDLTFIEGRQETLLGALLLAFAVFGTLSVIGARWLADRTLAPLLALVRQLRALDPERRGERVVITADSAEMGVIADAINRYVEELDALVTRERAFAAAASHELRTPIAVIQGAAETLALQGPQPALSRIERAVTMARHEIDALLALSRVHETPASEHFALDRWLQELAEPYLIAAPRAHLHWQIPGTTMVCAPRGAIAAIFTNLLRNALRVAGDGEVWVRVGADGFSVEDSGPGIAEADLPRVFEPGFHTRDGGTGMGLYIAQTLAQRMHWTLRLANRDGGGAIGSLRFTSPLPGS